MTTPRILQIIFHINASFMLNISILWEDSNLGNARQTALEDEGCITPTISGTVHSCHHGCIEILSQCNPYYRPSQLQCQWYPSWHR